MAKILVVDDSNMQRDMLRFSLNEGGYPDIVEAEDGNVGLEKAKTESFDVVITDINMPGMNGFELVTELRKLSAYQSKPILVLTTECTDEMKQRGKACGATGWIVKPFVPAQLLKVVSTVLKG